MLSSELLKQYKHNGYTYKIISVIWPVGSISYKIRFKGNDLQAKLNKSDAEWRNFDKLCDEIKRELIKHAKDE